MGRRVCPAFDVRWCCMVCHEPRRGPGRNGDRAGSRNVTCNCCKDPHLLYPAPPTCDAASGVACCPPPTPHAPPLPPQRASRHRAAQGANPVQPTRYLLLSPNPPHPIAPAPPHLPPALPPAAHRTHVGPLVHLSASTRQGACPSVRYTVRAAYPLAVCTTATPAPTPMLPPPHAHLVLKGNHYPVPP